MTVITAIITAVIRRRTATAVITSVITTIIITVIVMVIVTAITWIWFIAIGTVWFVSVVIIPIKRRRGPIPSGLIILILLWGITHTPGRAISRICTILWRYRSAFVSISVKYCTIPALYPRGWITPRITSWITNS
jgi:hypothetical protein